MSSEVPQVMNGLCPQCPLVLYTPTLPCPRLTRRNWAWFTLNRPPLPVPFLTLDTGSSLNQVVLVSNPLGSPQRKPKGKDGTWVQSPPWCVNSAKHLCSTTFLSHYKTRGLIYGLRDFRRWQTSTRESPGPGRLAHPLK